MVGHKHKDIRVSSSPFNTLFFLLIRVISFPSFTSCYFDRKHSQNFGKKYTKYMIYLMSWFFNNIL